ncbi:hypothetical protein [Cupriavidus lacunae]|nr:hypothetical protein [Cupriavidus lacunae]
MRQRHLRIIDRDGLASVNADLDQAPRRDEVANLAEYGAAPGERRLA